MRLLKLIYIEHEGSLLLIGGDNYMLKVSGEHRDMFKDAIDNFKDIDLENIGLNKKQITDLENTILNRRPIKNEIIKSESIVIEVLSITQEEPQEIEAFAKPAKSSLPGTGNDPSNGQNCLMASENDPMCVPTVGLDDDSFIRLP